MTSLDELRVILTRIEEAANQITGKLQISGDQIVVIGGLSDISEDLGLMKAGEFRSGKGTPGLGFTGVRMGAPGWTYGSHRYAIVGLDNDVLKFGLSAEDGNIFAYSGDIGGWTITDTTIQKNGVILDSANDSIYLGEAEPRLILDGTNKLIKSSSYAEDVAGFQISGVSGNAEFNNIRARGEIRSSVFTYNEISATAGTFGIFKSAGKLRSYFESVTAPATFNIDIEDPASGHTQLFAVGDILRIKDGLIDSWFTVLSVSDQTTFYRYECVLSSGTPSAFTSGAAVVDYGPSGQGFLLMSADDGNAPFYSVHTHAGSPWTTTTEVVRLGNMRNAFGTGANNRYGFGVGDYAGGNYMSFNAETANGFVVRGGSGAVGISQHGLRVYGVGDTDKARRISFTYDNKYDMLEMYSTYDTGSGLQMGWIYNDNIDAEPWTRAGVGLVAVGLPNKASLELYSDGEIKLNGLHMRFGGTILQYDPVDKTGLTVDTDSMSLWITDYVRTFNAGTYSQVVASAFSAPNWTASAASTISTRSANVFIDGAPTLTNFTAIRNYGLIVRNGGQWLENCGLNIGNGISAGVGSMSYSGNLMAYRNNTNYTGYIYVPLSTPLTSASWDGDTKTAGTYTIDANTVFGVPEGARSVKLLISGMWSTASSGNLMSIRPKSGSLSYGIIRGQIASIYQDAYCEVPLDANGQFDVVVGGTVDAAQIRVLGYTI